MSKTCKSWWVCVKEKNWTRILRSLLGYVNECRWLFMCMFVACVCAVGFCRVLLLSYYWIRYSNWNLLGLSWLGSWMLCECMRLCSWCRFEGHGAEGTFKEDLTVSTLDVGLYCCNISEGHTAVDTATKRGNLSQLEYKFFLCRHK